MFSNNEIINKAIDENLILITKSSKILNIIEVMKLKSKKNISVEEIEKIPTKIFEKNDKNEKCIICSSEYENNDQIIILDCKHEFHQECMIDFILNKGPYCPLDNTTIPFQHKDINLKYYQYLF
jgi:hypothetical protein